MATTTTNFDFTLPAVGGAIDADLWGDQLNGNWTSIDAILVATTANNTLSGNNTFSGDNSFTGQILTPDAGELTIATGVITVTGNYHTVDTEGDAATDDLDTINTGADGKRITLRIEDDARDVVIKNATGNILTPDGNDITLDTTDELIGLIYDDASSNWLVTAQGKVSELDASTTDKGLVQVATQAEIEAETATGSTGASLISTPADLKYHPGIAKAMVLYNGVTNTILDSVNVTSVTDNGTGDFTINFTTPFSSANYFMAPMVTEDGSSQSSVCIDDSNLPTASAFRVICRNNSSGVYDPARLSLTFYGDQ